MEPDVVQARLLYRQHIALFRIGVKRSHRSLEQVVSHVGRCQALTVAHLEVVVPATSDLERELVLFAGLEIEIVRDEPIVGSHRRIVDYTAIVLHVARDLCPGAAVVVGIDYT